MHISAQYSLVTYIPTYQLKDILFNYTRIILNESLNAIIANRILISVSRRLTFRTHVAVQNLRRSSVCKRYQTSLVIQALSLMRDMS